MGQARVTFVSRDNEGFASVRTLAALTGRSTGSVCDALGELRAAGVFVERGRVKRTGKPGKGPPIVAITDPPASPEGWERVVHAVRRYQEKVQARRHPAIVSPGGTIRRPQLSPWGQALRPPGGDRRGSTEGGPDPVAGAPARRRPRRPATKPAPSPQTAPTRREGEPGLQDAPADPAVAACAQLLLLARELGTPEPEARRADLAAAGYSSDVIARAMELAAQVEDGWPLGTRARAFPGGRVPPEQGPAGWGGWDRGGAAPRPHFLHDVPPSSIDLVPLPPPPLHVGLLEAEPS